MIDLVALIEHHSEGRAAATVRQIKAGTLSSDTLAPLRARLAADAVDDEQ